MTAPRFLLACTALAAFAAAHAEVATPGAVSFCPFALPADDGGRQRWINLAIVQFVETSANELKIVYGGGNLGAGHEVRIALPNADAVLAEFERMRDRAAACR